MTETLRKSAHGLLDLGDKTVLVTGASGGIGADIARTLAGAGAHLILHCSKDVSRLEGLARETGAIKTIAFDLAAPKAVSKMMNTLSESGLRPNVLINNAAVQTIAQICEVEDTDWQKINAVNLGGPYALTRDLAKVWIAQKTEGVIVNIASIEGLDPAAGHAHYAASKAGLIAFTRASALELGQYNIRVNAVAPGLIERPGLQDGWPEGVERWRQRAPLSRLGRGEDVANGVLFLCSSAAVWISGHTLVIDGGMSAQNRW